MPAKRRSRSVVTISIPGTCASKKKIDKEAQQALDEIGGIATADKKLKMHLEAAKHHLRNIMGDHHHL